MHLYLQLLIIAFLGQVIHLGLKGRSLKEKARAGNATFSYVGFIYEDLFGIVVTVAFVALVMFFVQDALVTYPKVFNLVIVKLLFSVFGYAGSDIALRFFGRTTKAINKVIDVKTNIADEKTK